MGSQNPSSNHSSRTYWTPTMERFFIDLMLEHMHRGNRIGHTFNKQAWSDMLAVFNAKFGSQYDKDVLKGRYTNLWKQFNDIKNLLSQNGFSWDETRQMVIANEYAWDAYIKDHPEARPYKTKVVLNFHDLCLIYGYTVADGRYSRSSHDIDVEDEAFFGDGTGSITPSGGERSRTEWTIDMDDYFIDLLLSQEERGNKLDNTFSKQAWTDMLTLFNAKFGPQHNKRVLRHRYKKLWKYYSDLSALIEQQGFSWDAKQNLVTADDDVWDAYIKAHPRARPYRGKTLPNYLNLGLLFRDAVSKGIQSDLRQKKNFKREVINRKAGSERCRTYWTPLMDKYLIDLMLDQVRRGNRIGQSFITQAWTDMVASFNTQFNSDYDKDVLKNRYKHFRRQYNEVKVILEHNGFSWDEEREMVMAEDHDWDAFIKAHPDARPYRVKMVPSYHKLCGIYGRDSFDGICSRFVRNVDPDIETSVEMIDSVRDWTASMEHYFVDLMLAQVQKENLVDPLLDERTWSDMVALFNEKFGGKYEKNTLKNQYFSLMKRYMEISNLLNQNGFAWDETRQTISAEDDAWGAYIEDHPQAISYKDKVLSYYNDLCVIFRATGSVGGQLDGIGVEIDQNTLEIRIDDISQDLEIPDPLIETPVEEKKRLAVVSPATGRATKVQKIDKRDKHRAFTDIPVVTAQLANIKSGKSYIAIESAIDALQAIPDIDDDLLLDGCDILEDEQKAKTFLALDATLRKKWLLRKLGRQ